MYNSIRNMTNRLIYKRKIRDKIKLEKINEKAKKNKEAEKAKKVTKRKTKKIAKEK